MGKEALATKYRPKRFADVVEQDVTKAILTEQLENKTFKNCLLFCGGAGTGKAQPLNSKVLTPKGFIKMRQVKIGMEVITGDYNTALISGVFPQGKREIYKIYLSNGDTVQVSDEHINIVYTENKEGKFEESTMLTKDLINIDYTNLFMRKIVGNGLFNAYYSISDIKFVGLKKCQCILVDAPEHTYITDNYIVTHNTTSARIFANEINEFKGEPIEIDAASNNSVDDARRIIESAKTQSLDSEYKVFVLDECVTGDTEILTDKGFKPIKDLDKTELIAQVTDDMVIEYVKPTEHIELPYEGYMYRVYNEDFSVLMSPHHVQPIISNATDDWKEFYIEHFCPNNEQSIVEYIDSNKDNNLLLYNCDSIKTEKLTYEGTIYCVKVPSHKIIIRTDSGFSFVTGNCHMLSNAAWNAMLKLVEEPPKKSVFLFCTTDPHKIPDTILSRVQRYNFQKISQQGIVNRLKYIIEQENKEDSTNLITYEESALEHIAKVADGGMRDSITLLDKSIGYNNNLTLNNVLEALGSVNYDTMFELIDALNIMDKKKVIEVVESIHRSGLDLKQFIKQYTLFILDVCKYDLFREFTYLQLPNIYKEKLDSYDDNAYIFFNQLLGEMSTLSNNLRYESMPKPVVEATFLQLCTEA